MKAARRVARAACMAAALAAVTAMGSCKGKEAPGTGAKPAPTCDLPSAGGAAALPDAGTGALEGQKQVEWQPLPIGIPDPRIVPEKTVPALYQKANKAFKKGDGAVVREALDQAIAKDPLFGQALWLRAQQHVLDEETAQAMAVLERLVALDCREYEPAISKAGWLGDIRKDEKAWKPFEEKVAGYHALWAEALAGPGVLFIQARWTKLSQPDEHGETMDLTYARGSLVFWARKAGRFLVLAGGGDVAGFLQDRERGVVYLVHWQPHPDALPGALGRTLVSRIDLRGAGLDPKPIRIADAAGRVKAAIDGEGELIFEVDPVPEGEPADADTSAETGSDGVSGAPEEEAAKVGMAHFPDGTIVDGVLPPDMEWQLEISLGETSGPDPLGDPGSTETSPKAKRGGTCLWVEAGAAVCFVPTKPDGVYHDLELREEGAAIMKLAPEWIPIVQFDGKAAS